MRPRFRLRTLLILTALAAAACYGWIVRPTILAERFASAIDAQDYAAADALCIDPNRQFVNRTISDFMQNVYSHNSPFMFTHGAGFREPPFVIEIDVQPRTWGDVWRGRRRLAMTIRENPPFRPAAPLVETKSTPEFDELGRRYDGLPMFSITASAVGIQPPPDPYVSLWTQRFGADE